MNLLNLVNFCIASDYHRESIDLEEEIEIYKSVLDEIREYIKNENYKDENICVVDGIEILRILDKVDN